MDNKWAKLGIIAQWTSAAAALISAIAAWVIGYSVYQLNQSTYGLNESTYRVAGVTAQQAFFNRSLRLVNEYFYRLYEPTVLSGGRCIAYMNAIPNEIFRTYLHPEGIPLFEIAIVDVGKIAQQIDDLQQTDGQPLDDIKRAAIKRELYVNLDICLDLNKDEAFSVPNAKFDSRAEIIKKDLPKRYGLFGERYVPALDYRKHALIMWFDDATYEERHKNEPEKLDEYKEERKWRAREVEFIKELFIKSICYPSRVAQLLKKIEHVNGAFYEDVIVGKGLFPRLHKFVHEVCPKDAPKA